MHYKAMADFGKIWQRCQYFDETCESKNDLNNTHKLLKGSFLLCGSLKFKFCPPNGHTKCQNWRSTL